MKKVLILIAILFLSSSAFAKTYVLYDTNTLEVVSIDEDDSAFVSQGFNKAVLYGDYSDLTYPDDFYVLKNNKIKLNATKIEEESIKDEKKRKKQLRKAKIKKKMEEMAEKELIASGELEVE